MYSKGLCNIELKIRRYPGILAYVGDGSDRYYLDQIYKDEETPDDIPLTELVVDKESDNWIHARKLGWYLNKWYRISIEDYYNLIDHGSIENIRKCSNPNCNKLARWSGKINIGYNSLCGDEDCRIQYQSILSSDGTSGFSRMHQNPEEFPEFIKYSKSGGIFGETDSDYYIQFMIKSARSRFINQGSLNDISYLYVTWTKSGKFKFGITTDIDIRYSQSSKVDSYINPHILMSGTRLEIADIEYNIKSKLKIYCEWIEDKNIINQFWIAIKNLKYSNSTTISTLEV